MSANVPAVSIVLPVYNSGRFLEPAVRSMLNQTFRNFELLLLNDGSTDGSLEVMQQLAKEDPRCRVHSRANKGLVTTLNEGIELARAPYIARMDGDDLSYPPRLALQVDYLDQHPDCVAIGSEIMLIDPEGEHLMPFGLPLTHEAIDAHFLSGRGGAIVHPAATLRRSALLEIGGYREEYKHAEDYDLFLRLAEVGKLANLPDVLLDYRQHLGSIGHSHTRVQIDAIHRALAEAQRRRGLAATPPFAFPDTGPTALGDLHRKWAWWALTAGNLKSARKHAWLAVRFAPLATANLRLLACVVRGH